MRVSRLLALSVLLALTAGAAARSQILATQVLELIPAQTQIVVCYPDFRRLEAKWSQVAGFFGGERGFLELQGQTGIDPSRLGPGPIFRVSFRTPGAGETWAWLLPAKDPQAVLKGLRPKGAAGLWTWEAPASAPKAQTKPQAKVPAPAHWFGTAKAGYLVVADGQAGLAAFKQPARRRSAELAPYTAWLARHDVSVVVSRAAVEDAAQSASLSLKRPAGELGPGGKPAKPGAKVIAHLQTELDHWVQLARTSVHHVLGGIEISEDGGLRFEARALLSPGSPLSRELETLPPVAGHPLKGLAASDFALALGGEWTALFDFQAAFMEDLGQAGKLQPATVARLRLALETQNHLVRSMAGTFAAPAPRGPMMSGLTSLVRVSDSGAYLAALEETSRAQGACFQDLGMPEAIAFTRDVLPGVPSCGVTTRLGPKTQDPASAPSQMAMAMLFGGESIQMSMAALDDHRVLAVLGGPDLLRARMEAVQKEPEGLAPSILAVEPNLGREPRFALYLDPRGLRDLAQVMVGAFGGAPGRELPAMAAVPAAGLTLSLDPSEVNLRGSVKAETLQATATLFKAMGALFATHRMGAPRP